MNTSLVNLQKHIFTLLIGLLPWVAFGTHNRAGEITYRSLGGNTYEITVTTYTKVSSQIDRCELTIEWGDGTSSTVYRVNGGNARCPNSPARDGINIGNDIRLNIYRGEHTFPTQGYYTISVQDLNRNAGVVNIPNSVQVPFYVSTTLFVRSDLGPNNSPTLLNPPIDQGCVNRLFIHNAGAFDEDGDSLAYELVQCKGLNGRNIPETYNPSFVQDSVEINPITGDFIWDVPKAAGQFNFAFVIKEFRKNRQGNYELMGSVTRDMQIDIETCSNNPPVIDPLGPFCIEAGNTLNFQVTATDPDNDPLALSGSGGPFEVTPSALFPDPATGPSPLTANFSWTPGCDQVRLQPYYVTFRAEDIPATPPPLVGLRTVEITVIAPRCENPAATANQTVIDLTWDANLCTDAEGYDLYRRNGTYGYVPADCETGVPDFTGYEYIGSTAGWSSTMYTDSVELDQGVQYCYMVVATFPDGSESVASVEFCAELPQTLPIMTHVDVNATDAVNGEVQVSWIHAPEIDSNAFPPPYTYELERAPGIDGTNFTTIATLPDTDTTYLDAGINTVDGGWNYRVRIFNNNGTSEIGVSGSASSIYAIATPRDEAVQLTFNSVTPWVYDTTIVFRETSPGSGIWDSIGFTTTNVYIDTGLINSTQYCYYGLGVGRYTGTGLPAPLLNRSQQVCSEPADNEAPCAPEVSWFADCENAYLRLSWTIPPGCPNDIVSYNIYYRPTPDDPWPADPLVSGITGTVFEFTEGSIVGCYAVTAVDDADIPNESDIIEAFCIEGCAQIQLPNVFSPDGDGVNDFFFPVRDANGNPFFRDIADFQIDVYNRWGRLVYRSTDPNEFVTTGWDGNDRTTGEPCVEGVYFYICNYRARSLGTAPSQVLQGSIHLFR
ncbi:T9SS type B sorting domain-containing protein [Phaeocystidibacter luteus]|uniref:Gliding motility-associated C-terminal domain-containing protein n=1 Tax=Phaeocystidibacter luteus TaxID=911197 RepID=A0A6N6RHA8_9FLAO|nr:gliding motility-associated C-terminal domain-containing protein [Phaeocystidibacter luteus]KAB2808652.1 gliding motility-associated C-terminal domain-containing protein [Phaeocystidibacter luteus]